MGDHGAIGREMRGCHRAEQRRDGCQRCRRWSRPGREIERRRKGCRRRSGGRGERHGHDIRQTVEARDRRLNGHDVVDVVLRVDPEIGRGERARAQGRQQTVRDIALGHSYVGGTRAVHVDLDGRVVGNLSNAHVFRSGDQAQSAHQLERDGQRFADVGSLDLHVNRRRQSEVEHPTDDIGRLEVELRT